jgi:hypothetical protein
MGWRRKHLNKTPRGAQPCTKLIFIFKKQERDAKNKGSVVLILTGNVQKLWGNNVYSDITGWMDHIANFGTGGGGVEEGKLEGKVSSTYSERKETAKMERKKIEQ